MMKNESPEMQILRLRMKEMKRQAHTPAPFSKYFIGTGLLLLLTGAVILALDYRFASAAHTTEGLVVGLFSRGSRSGFAPDIRYEVNGESYMYYSEEYSRPPRYHEGDRVTIYYRPDNPKEANTGIKWIVISIVSGLGLFFCGMGYLLKKLM